MDASLFGEFLGVESLPILEGGYIKQHSSTSQSVAIRPNAVQVMMVIIAKECNKNKENYKAWENQQSEWEIYVGGFMGNPPHEDEVRVKLMEVERLMSFD